MAEESGGGGERTEAPTAKRRADFRKKGQVAQSKEVQTAALFTILTLFWFFYAPVFLRNITNLLHFTWTSSGEYIITPLSLMQLFTFIAGQLGKTLAPLFLLALTIGFFATFFQIGWLFTGQPLVPDLKKLDPIKGMGRFFSKKSLVELVKSLCKVLLIGWVAFQTLRNEFDGALILGEMPPIETLNFLGKTAILVLAKISAVLIFLAVLDFAFVRWEMEEKMKMTKQEVKEEQKETDGDPYLKSKIRSMQQQLSRGRMMAAVPEADVVITNPTRIAVAIKYDQKTMKSPEILAKGQELVAGQIRKIARENDIPIIENPPVARLLHKKVEIGQAIPEELFKAVAEILAYVYSLKTKNR